MENCPDGTIFDLMAKYENTGHLKENVIIGRLIPAGTGFNSFENLKKVDKEKTMNLLLKYSSDNKLKTNVLNSRLN